MIIFCVVPVSERDSTVVQMPNYEIVFDDSHEHEALMLEHRRTWANFGLNTVGSLIS